MEDSPDRANGKIIIFEVKERPQIRRIRYDGNHSDNGIGYSRSL